MSSENPKEAVRSAASSAIDPPAWAVGYIGREAADFLADLVGELAPDDVIEIGVASGMSSLTILRALPSVGRHGRLHSFDIESRCYFDATRAVGSVVDELAPELRTRWSLSVGNARTAGERLRGARAAFAFVDGNHMHPWATLDVLALLPALADDAWIAVHDVSASRIAPWTKLGPERLLALWPGQKRVASESANIGAIRLPGDPATARRWLAGVLRDRWQVCVDVGYLDALGVEREIHARREDLDFHKPGFCRRVRDAAGGRKLVVWGAGGAGRACVRILEAAGLRPQIIVDSDPAKAGAQVAGLPVVGPEALAPGEPRPLVVVASTYADEIVRGLAARGFVAERDVVVFTLNHEPTQEAQSASGKSAPHPARLLGMTTSEEQEYLADYAKSGYTGAGEIVELGTWLGATTIPLARGLKARGAAGRKVHSYDMFVWRESMDAYAGELAGKIRPGESFLPHYMARIAGLEDVVEVHAGDLRVQAWSGGPIEFLLVDAMKNWELHDAIMRTFMPAVMPGTGLVMHQDFKFWACPWVHLSMFRLRDYYSIAHDLAASCAVVFRMERAPARALLETKLEAGGLTRREIDEAYRHWSAVVGGARAGQLAAARVLALWEADLPEDALVAFAAILASPRKPHPRFLASMQRRLDPAQLQRAAGPWRVPLERAVAQRRPVVLWGAGSACRALLQHDLDLRSWAGSIVDGDAGKHGRTFEGLRVSAPEALLVRGRESPFVVIATSWAEEVASRLTAIGMRLGADFAIAPWS